MMINDFGGDVPALPDRKEWRFVDELKAPPRRAVRWNPNRSPRAGEIDLRQGMRLHCDFFDAAGGLFTAEEDLRRFLSENGLLRQDGLPLTTERSDDLSGEAFRLCAGSEGVRILAGDAEGVRRGIYFLEDALLSSEGPFLKAGITTRTPWLRNRISRCFFGPIKRPPFNRDELMDDVDYYPEEYLNRLAHEGINGLWLTIVFRDLCKTSITDLDPHAERRLEKLRRTVEKCLRYGIRTWAFCIEPAAFSSNDPLLARHPKLGGARVGDRRCFCPSSELARQYLYESTHWLFSQVPELGGILDITHGERPTTCLSSVGCTFDDPVDCPRCGPLPKWEIMRRSLSAMRDGMKAASPQAEFISWFYMPTSLPRADWVFEAAAHVPEGIILQYNFESNGMKRQLNRPRIGGDYWLSYTGPSDDFARVAVQSARVGTELSAKIQVGCSHEVATIPFVPVPGLLYRKYRKMRAQGCAHVMQCWYFGNYPGVMNRAAGLLASEKFEDSEETFLLRLARPEWGEASEAVVKAWQLLADGYVHFPMTNVFQYYGPIQDGVAWPLHLKPAMRPLAPSWKPGYPPSGDVIGECLEHFTLPEALALCERMSAAWHAGTELFLALRPRFLEEPERLRDIGLVEALDIQMRNGRNILRFYLLRAMLINGTANAPMKALGEMEEIVREEIGHSERLCALCEADSRLGFHSEAESHKYYPARLRWRIAQLRRILEEDFPEVRQALLAGKCLSAEVPGSPLYRCGSGWVECGHFRWRVDREGNDLIAVAECDSGAGDSLLLWHLIDRAGTCYPTTFKCNPDNSIYDESWGEKTIETPPGDRWRARIVAPALSWGMDSARQPAWFSFYYAASGSDGARIEETWPPTPSPVPTRLRLGAFNPGMLARLD